jgi:hypothetical protein
MHVKLWFENLKGRNLLKDLEIDGWIILKCTLRKRVIERRLGPFGSEYGLVVDMCEHNNGILIVVLPCILISIKISC